MPYHSKNSKLTDKMLRQSVVTSIVGIVICLVMLTTTTWAWHSTSVDGGSGVLMGGRYDLEIDVQDENDETLVLRASDKGGVICSLEECGKYTFKLKASDDTTASTGYCVIWIEGKPYLTAPITATGQELCFTVETERESVEVRLVATWGAPVQVDVTEDGIITVEATEHTTE